MLDRSVPTSFIVKNQVPGFVREKHDKFISFLETYYEYMDQDQGINDYIRNVLSFLDPDKTTEYLLLNFFDELKNIPKSLAVDKRFLAKHIYDLYDAKGTESSIETLFRILFDEDVSVIYPKNNILIASDGRWNQEVFITVESVYGSLPVGENIEVPLIIRNQYGDYAISSHRVEFVLGLFRVYFSATQSVRLHESSYVLRYDSDNLKIFSGLLKKSPSRINVVSGGKFWQRGTILQIPGSISNTVCRVINTRDDGVLANVEILEYGHGHSENQTITTSPYPSKPAGSTTDISYQNNVYTISITDYVDYSMVVDGVTSGVTENSYYSQDYASDLYSGSPVISTSYITTSTVSGNTGDLTMQDWLDSRTVLTYEYSLIGRPIGDWNGEYGKLSTASIRLQDNYYYQLYSYAIKNTRCINRWKNAIELIHPAGLKYFGEFIKTYETDESIQYVADTTITIT